MNLVQTNKHNAADDIRSDPDALKAIGDKTWKIYGPPGTGKTWTLLNIIKYGIGKKHIVRSILVTVLILELLLKKVLIEYWKNLKVHTKKIHLNVLKQFIHYVYLEQEIHH
jgi:DNA replication protein DnaC